MREASVLGGFTQWLMRQEGGAALARAFLGLSGAACATAGISAAGLRRHIGGEALQRFVDFVLEHEAARRGDDYCLGAGGSDPAGDYLEALRRVGLGLYRVVRIQRGLGFVADDLLFPGPTLQVVDPRAAKRVQAGDVVCGRLLRRDGITAVAAGFLMFPAEPGSSLVTAARAMIAETQGPGPLLCATHAALARLAGNAWIAWSLEQEKRAVAAFRRSA